METAPITNPSGLGEATAHSVENQTVLRRISSAQTLEYPGEAGRSVAKVGVEDATKLPKR